MRVGSHAVVVTSCIVFALGAIAACSAGSAGGSPDGGTSGTSGTGGTSGTSGTSGDSGGPCTELVVGGVVDDAIAPSAPSRVYAQAVADAAGAAKAWDIELAGACRRLAQSLDATKTNLDEADAKPEGRERTTALCQLAVTAIVSTKAAAGGSVQTTFVPVYGDLSVADKATCQGKCANAPACDVVANPPVCTGGPLFVECRGSCAAVTSATVNCEPCASTCQAACTGSSCSGSCNAPAGGSVTCDGKCSGAVTPLFCRGGKLEGMCPIDARCDASCDVTVATKVNAPKPAVSVNVLGASSPTSAAKLKTALEAELPAVLSLKARFESLAKLSGTLASAAGASDMKPACLVLVASAASAAISDIMADSSNAANVAGVTN